MAALTDGATGSIETGPARERQDATLSTRALDLAEVAITRGQTPFGAVVVDRDGQLVGEGHNTVRADRDPTATGRSSPSATRGAAWVRGRDWPAARSTPAASRACCARSSSRRLALAAWCTQRGGRTCPPTGRCSGRTSSAAAWVNAQSDWAPLTWWATSCAPARSRLSPRFPGSRRGRAPPWILGVGRTPSRARPLRRRGRAGG